MLIGAHVRAGRGLVRALEHGASIGAEVIQIHAQSPRMWRPSSHGPDVLRSYREAQTNHPSVIATFCHATYLINLATPDPKLAERSRGCLKANLVTATGMGSAGLVLHIGSHRGLGFEASLPGIVDALLGSLDSVVPDPGAQTTPILLENAAGAGNTVGRSFDELAAVIEAAGRDERLGVCVDTQHLWASGVSFRTVADADALVDSIAKTVGLDRVRCLHLNDSKVPFGANRDRHENIGEGTIGEGGFSAILGHPGLQELPAVLEVPGDGHGPRAEDVAGARRLWHLGLDVRRAADRVRPAL